MRLIWACKAFYYTLFNRSKGHIVREVRWTPSYRGTRNGVVKFELERAVMEALKDFDHSGISTSRARVIIYKERHVDDVVQ